MKKKLIVGFIIALTALVAVGCMLYIHQCSSKQQESPEQPQEEQPINDQDIESDSTIEAQQFQHLNMTEKVADYKPEQEANPLLVGLWVEDSNPQHYKAYYDDACEEEGFFWGKEWDESEGIYEDYLTYHGNGWFKWSKTQEELIEISVADQQNMVVPNQYIIAQLNDSVYVYNSYKITETVSQKIKKIPFRTFQFHRQ